MESEICMSFLQINIKIMWPGFLVINKNELMINLAGLLSLIQVKMLFIKSWLKKVSFCSRLVKKHFNKELVMTTKEGVWKLSNL